MTNEEKRFDRREEARLDDMYDAQCEPDGYEVDEAFNRWWNADGLIEDNPFNRDTPAFWAWEGWMAGVKAHSQTPTKIMGPNLEGVLNAAGFHKQREWQGLTDEDRQETERWIEFKEAGGNEPVPIQKILTYVEAKLKEKNT